MRATIGRGSRGRRGLALIEVVVIVTVLAVLAFLFLPAVSRCGWEEMRRAQCAQNLKSIAVGLLEYETSHGALPPSWTLDAGGRSSHDWRTLILPYVGLGSFHQVERESLYHSINLATPWNDPANHTARGTRVTTFICPGSPDPRTSTTYLATLAPSGCLVPGKPRPLADVTDGASATIMAVEAGDDHAVPWIAPRDADESVLLATFRSKPRHAFTRGWIWDRRKGTHAAFVDGTVRFLNADTPPRTLRALTTIDGGEKADLDSY